MSGLEASPLAAHCQWHGEQWQHCRKLYDTQSLPHALLLAGPPGIGKKRFAYALAYSLLCEAATDQACGECKACRMLVNDTHGDFKVLQPLEGSRQIKIDQVRELLNFTAKTSSSGGYRIVIVHPADAMNNSAANSLLKTLEEPGEKTLIILVSDSVAGLMPTIRSRCQRIMFPLPSRAEVLPWLRATTANESLAEELLVVADGQPLTALDYLNNDSLPLFERMRQGLSAMLAGQLSPLTLAEQWKDFELQVIVDWLQRELYRLIKALMSGTGLPGYPMLSVVHVKALFTLYEELQALSVKLRRGATPNRQLSVEAFLLRGCELLAIK